MCREDKAVDFSTIKPGMSTPCATSHSSRFFRAPQLPCHARQHFLIGYVMVFRGEDTGARMPPLDSLCLHEENLQNAARSDVRPQGSAEFLECIQVALRDVKWLFAFRLPHTWVHV